MKTPNLATISAMTEEDARKYLERVRWPRGPVCVKCGAFEKIYPLTGAKCRPGLYKCGSCKRQFTVTVGTIFHRSKVGLRLWIMAFHLVCSSKKGISALQLQRNLGLGSYKTAWFMAHRIRHAMRSEPLRSKLKGTVESDETWVGGKPRKNAPNKPKSERKTPVVVLIERDGRARSKPVTYVNAWTVREYLRDNVDPSAEIRTDESNVYLGVHKDFVGHETTNHSKGEYLRGNGIHSNGAESYFALLKRGVHGTFHHVSRTHLHRYCDEFSFRWSTRKVSDGERMDVALKAGDGKRLTYQDTKAG